MLVHERYGEGGRPTLLLHGFLGSGRNLATLARRWTSRDPTLGVATVDLPGHGRSPALPPGADLAAAAAAVLETARALFPAGEPVHLVGHSLGGRVALRALQAAPAQVEAVTLLDIAPGPVVGDGTTVRTVALLLAAPARFEDRAAGRAFFLAGGLSLALADWLLMNLEALPGEGGLGWRIDRSALASFATATAREDLWPVVAAHPGRVRCLRGARSAYVRDEDLARLERLGAAPAVTLAGAGHFLHVEAPAALLEALLGAAPSPGLPASRG